ncbi:MFS transporter [Kineosporia succinea]|uniref:EmrB/QacA subfamily drug resistance transporter n=1 Tax=Kineosporia succinea TaxID=84632 RepID=A0ABT9P563_9ACTN|nr:MFS transporter [Kineosporia succinea]MDP9827612.1 EmrB/QacA subfamily drug resistance transporter [Kineosporia succinea]
MSQSTSAASTTASSARWLTLTTVALAQLMVVLDTTVVNIALPSAQADLGFSDGDRQWIVTAYSLAFGSLLLLGGRLSDLIGRRRTFITALIGFAVASALGGAAPSFGLLVAARALQGVFGALLAPTALAVLATTFVDPVERRRAFGIFGAIAGMGGAIGLLLGGVLTENLDWRWNLYVNCFIAVIAVVGALFFLPHVQRSGPRPKLDVPGTVLVSAALFGLVYGFSHAETDGWGNGLTIGMLIGSVVLGTAFVWWQTRAEHPLMPLSIVLDRNRSASYLSVLLAGIGMFGIFLFLTYYLQITLGYSPIKTGLSFLPMIVALVFTAQISSNFLLPRFGPRVMVPSGMVFAAVGAFWLTALDLNSAYFPGILFPLVLMGMGFGQMMPAAIQTATLNVDPRFAGVASALVNTGQQVGGSLGTALINTLAASAATSYLASHQPATQEVLAQAQIQSYSTAYAWVGGFFVAGAVLAALLYRSRTETVQVTATTGPGAGASDAEPVIMH